MIESRRANIGEGVRRAWAEGKFARQHPPDCGHCKAHRGVPKRRRTPEERAALSALFRSIRGGPGYRAAHRRVEKDRGLASAHVCISCGKQAREWALVVNPTERLTDDRGRVFSGQPIDYEPLCVSCHKYEDARRRRAA